MEVLAAGCTSTNRPVPGVKHGHREGQQVVEPDLLHGELAKEVEAHRLGRQEVAPQAPLVDELAGLCPLQAELDLLLDGDGQEVRSRRPGLVDREAAAKLPADRCPVPTSGAVDARRQAPFLPPDGRQQARHLAEVAAVGGFGDQVAGARSLQSVDSNLPGSAERRFCGCSVGRVS